MMGEILLVRHGRVAIESDGLFSREEFLRYLQDYDAASLLTDSRPPQELTERLRQTHGVFASELPRARESAQNLSIESEIRFEALFNEEPHHFVPRIPIRMPLLVWFTWSRLYETTNSSVRCAVSERSAIAAQRLVVEARYGPTALIGHGWFNRAIAHSLIERGWRLALRQGGSAPWSFYVLSIGE